MRRSLMFPISAIATASASATRATGSAWKLPPEITSPVSANTSGLSETAFASSIRIAAASRSVRRHGAEHLRDAAQAVRILNAPAVAVRLVDLAAFDAARAARRRRRSATRARARRGCAGRTASRCRAPLRSSARRRRATRRTRPRRRRAPRSASAVDTCVPLSSASPSFALQLERRDPDRTPARRRAGHARSPATSRIADADQRGRQVRERREIARRADRALPGDHREHVALQAARSSVSITLQRTPE